MHRSLCVLVAAACLLSACGPRAGETTAPASAGEVDWPSFGQDPGGAQYSPLAQVTPANVGDLQLVWEHHSGDFKPGKAGVGTSLEVTPLKVNGALYYCTPLDRVFALDPATGRQLWVFDPYAKGPDGKAMVSGFGRQGTCRGVAFWQDAAAAGPRPQACARRIFRADTAGRLFAIDAETGRPCGDFGPASHPGYVSNRDYENHGEGYVGVSSPPAVVGDTVVIGGASKDGAQDANDGMVRAFDVRTGAPRWSFDPIPEPYRRQTGAANVWSTLSVDPKNGLVFLPTTSPSTDYYGGARRFDMPLTNAIVALHADTGAVAWSFQTVRHDLWDYDLPGHPLLVTIRKDGRPLDVVIQQTKTGHLFVLERLTGKPVFPIDERPVPPSTLPGEAAAATQPVPRLPEAFARTSVTRADIFGIVGLDRLWCRHAFDKMRYQGLFTPPALDEYLQMPSTLGGGNWGGAAYDPATNSVIVKASNIATRLRMVRKAGGPAQANVDFMTRPLDGPYGIKGGWFVSPLGIPCTPPPYGTLTAISMDTGKARWQVPLGQTRRHGITAPAFLGWGSPSVGGPMVTAGGLVFIGGALDGKLRAFDARTGRELWKTPLPAPGTATPMTYSVGGRQFVVIAAGGSALAETRLGDALMAYALKAR